MRRGKSREKQSDEGLHGLGDLICCHVALIVILVSILPIRWESYRLYELYDLLFAEEQDYLSHWLRQTSHHHQGSGSRICSLLTDESIVTISALEIRSIT